MEKKFICKPSEFAHFWGLDPEIHYLNHGSFGACPKPLLEKQAEYRLMLEREPIRFMVGQLEPMLKDARMKLASLVQCDPADLVFVQNATSGVNTVFRSLDLGPDDEILFTNHIYGACRRTLEYISIRTGAKLVEAVIPFPLSSSDQMVEAILDKVTPSTRIALIDHISSATALIFPAGRIVNELNRMGIDTMIDGAHAPGAIHLDISAIGAAYYTANCHKWLCAPKGAAILHVRKDKQKDIVPLTISHAGHQAESFEERFFWPGTWDPSAFLCAGDAVDWLNSLMPDGIGGVMARNRSICLDARRNLCKALSMEEPSPEEMIACLASIPLPAPSVKELNDYKSFLPLQEKLFSEYHIEIPVWRWSAPESGIIRIAVQLYNTPDQFRYLAEILRGILTAKD